MALSAQNDAVSIIGLRIRGFFGEGAEPVELILKYYEKLSEKFRKIIPLCKVYIPIAKEE